MLKFDNTHIFSGYLKQLLSTVSLPVCKIYSKDFANYSAKNGKEDPRIVESFGALNSNRSFSNVNYLKNNKICNLYYDSTKQVTQWKILADYYYDKDIYVPGFTRRLKSLGPTYDTKTHEYLGDFLRFLRDYYNINLMSLYNCFSNRAIYNIDLKRTISTLESANDRLVVFNSADSNFKIFALPVKLFSEYTIAIDSNQGIELFCGLYTNSLDASNRAVNLFNKTYQRVDKTMFNQPFIYDKLSHKYWTLERELAVSSVGKQNNIALGDPDIISRCDLINREQELKLFIKIPTSCKSSITVLEGDFRAYNDFSYQPSSKIGENIKWDYKLNHSIIDFNVKDKPLSLNSDDFKPISKLQLLAFNTGESYPFADRLIEYLSGSATLPVDPITDNIKRAQKVMTENNHWFKIDGIWENKMQKIAYDYMINAGPIVYNPETGKLEDKRQGEHNRIGYTSKSNLYDILGYIDKDIEKYYASWRVVNNEAKVHNSIQNVDIYNGLYDI